MPLSPLMDKSLEDIVVAMCADFERRDLAIKEKALPKRVLMEYKFLNLKILEATMEIVGTRNARIFINEIGARRGYAKSDVDEMSEPTYKRKKAEAKLNIAKKLSLL